MEILSYNIKTYIVENPQPLQIMWIQCCSKESSQLKLISPLIGPVQFPWHGIDQCLSLKKKIEIETAAYTWDSVVHQQRNTNRYCIIIFSTLQMRFLADLVNCHVIVAASLLAMFDNFVEVTLEDNIPQVL